MNSSEPPNVPGTALDPTALSSLSSPLLAIFNSPRFFSPTLGLWGRPHKIMVRGFNEISGRLLSPHLIYQEIDILNVLTPGQFMTRLDVAPNDFFE